MEVQHHGGQSQQQQQQHGSGTKVVVAAIGGLAIGGSLLCLMGLSFLATMTLLVLSSPLLLIFSPLLLFAGFVFVGTLAGFSVAAAMALTGLTTLGWVVQEFGSGRSLSLGFGDERRAGFGGVGERLLKEKGKDWGRFLHHGMMNDHQDTRMSSRG